MSHYEVRFPIDDNYAGGGAPQMAVDVARMVSGREKRNVRWSRPLWKFTAIYRGKTPTEWQSLLSLWMLAEGNAHSFRFRNDLDWKTCTDQSRNSGTVAYTDQPLKNTATGLYTGDGSTTTFQAVKRYTYGGSSYNVELYKLVTSTIVAGYSGSQQAFSVNVDTGVITFTTPPGNGVAATWGGEFDTPVRFDLPADSELFAQWATAKTNDVLQIPLMEVRV